MRKDKGSEFIYSVDFEHDTALYGVHGFKTFYDRASCMEFVESLAANNPDLSVSVRVRPRFVKRNVLAAS